MSSHSMSRRKKAMSYAEPNLLKHGDRYYHDPYDTSWVDNLESVDSLIKEYLIFRGYHRTWESFYRERKRDQSKTKNLGGYQVRLQMETIILCTMYSMYSHIHS